MWFFRSLVSSSFLIGVLVMYLVRSLYVVRPVLFISCCVLSLFRCVWLSLVISLFRYVFISIVRHVFMYFFSSLRMYSVS